MTKRKLEIEKIIKELEEILGEEQRKYDNIYRQNKYSLSPPPSFLSDMNGCERGISMARNIAISFLKEKLL
jgi:hypothetical protein